MGVLDNTTITVDAILTKKGRELLAQGEGKFKITKFALADDEIDYGLYDITHPNGSNFYGAAIENMNLLEAIPNQSLAVRYFLTNNAGTPGGGPGSQPIVQLTGASSIIQLQVAQYTAATDNFATELYDFTLSSNQYAFITTGVVPQAPPQEQAGPDLGSGLGSVSGYGSSGGSGGTSGGTSSTSIRGTSVSIQARSKAVMNFQERQVVLTAVGVDSGATATKVITLTTD